MTENDDLLEEDDSSPLHEAAREGDAELAAGADPTIPGWMGISAVDQAHFEVLTGLDSPEAREIQRLFVRFPSKVRDRLV